MSQGRVIDIMIIAFLQLTVLQFFGKAHRSSEFRRNLYGIYTEFIRMFFVLPRQEIFGGNLF